MNMQGPDLYEVLLSRVKRAKVPIENLETLSAESVDRLRSSVSQILETLDEIAVRNEAWAKRAPK